METPIRLPHDEQTISDSDEEAMRMFEQVQPQQPMDLHQSQQSQQEISPKRLKKVAKEEKRSAQKKKKLIAEKKSSKKKSHHKDKNNQPRKRLKKSGQESQPDASHSQAMSHKSSSSDDSEPQSGSDGEDELARLNPKHQQHTYKNSQRKKKQLSRLEKREGFCLEELGNEPVVKKSDSEYEEDKDKDDDNSGEELVGHQKKQKAAKQRKTKPKMSQEKMMELLKQAGVDSEEGEADGGVSYDNGLEDLSRIKAKKNKNAIKISNKFFEDLKVDTREDGHQEHGSADMLDIPLNQNLQLEFKPRPQVQNTKTSSFLKKVQTFKTRRGLLVEDINLEILELAQREKAKLSMAKLMDGMMTTEHQDELDLEIKVPIISRGRSSDLINNTLFLTRTVSRNTIRSSESIAQPQPEETRCKPVAKKDLSRGELFKAMANQSKLRKSRYLSEEDIVNSFRKTDLNELEEARKRIEEKRRKEALRDFEEEDQQGEESEGEMSGMHIEDIHELLMREELGDDYSNEINSKMPGDHQKDSEQRQQEAGQTDRKIEQFKQEQESVQIKNSLKQEPMRNDKEDQQKGEEQQRYEHPQAKKIQEEENQGQQLVEDAFGQEINSKQEQQQQYEQEEEEEEQQQEQQQEQEEENEQEQEQEQNQRAESEGRLLGEEAEYVESYDHQAMQLEQDGIMLNKRAVGRNPQVGDASQKSQMPIESTKQLTTQGLPIADEFKHFRKLRKIAQIVANRRNEREKLRRKAEQFLEEEAEVGSDNEDHDDQVKHIDYAAEEAEYEGVDLDEELQELIDNAVDIDEADEQAAFRKYLDDVRVQDREELRKILKGEFREKRQEVDLQMEEDDKNRQQRMQMMEQWINQRDQDEHEQFFGHGKQGQKGQDEESSQSGLKEGGLDVEAVELGNKQEQTARLEEYLSDYATSKKPNSSLSQEQNLFDLAQYMAQTCSALSIRRKSAVLPQKTVLPVKLKKSYSLLNDVLAPQSGKAKGQNNSKLGKPQQKTLFARMMM